MPTAQTEVSTRPANELFFRGLAIALMLAFPAIYFSGSLFGAAPNPKAATPRWTQLFLVTVAEWPTDTLEEEAFARFTNSSTSFDQLYSPARSTAANAASLWTGRFPSAHGVHSSSTSLPPSTWTLSESLRSSGARTAAFLAEPLIRDAGIEGFDTVIEDASLDSHALVKLAVEHLSKTSNERNCVWVHLKQPTAEELSQLLLTLQAGIHGEQIRHESMIAVMGFGSAGSSTPDGQSRAPLIVMVPGGTGAGLKGNGAASLVDVAGTLHALLKLPDPTAPQKPLQSRGEHLWRLLNGGNAYQWLFIEGPNGDVLRFGRTRVSPDKNGTLIAEQTDDPSSDAGFYPAPKQLQADMIGQYRQLQQLLEN